LIQIPSDGRTSTFDAADDNLEIVLLNELSSPINTKDAESINKAKNFYTSCMNMTTIEQNGAEAAIIEVLQQGGWPMAGDNFDSYDISDDQKLAEVLHKFAVNMVEQPLISIYVGVDESSVENHLASADQPSLFLGTDKFYMSSKESEKNKALKQAYIDFATDLAELYCKSNDKSECNKNSMTDAAEKNLRNGK